MTADQENRVYWRNGNEKYYIDIKKIYLEIKYFLFYISFCGKLDWEKSWFKKRKDGHKVVYDGILFGRLMNLSFCKIGNTDKYNTSVSHIGDLFVNISLENSRDLNNFCNKNFITKERCDLVRTPTKYEFLKYFYPELRKIKRKENILYFNIFNVLIKIEEI